MRKINKWFMLVGAIFLAGCMDKSVTEIKSQIKAVEVTPIKDIETIIVEAVPELSLPILEEPETILESEVVEILPETELDPQPKKEIIPVEVSVVEESIAVEAEPMVQVFSYETSYQTPKGETPMKVAFTLKNSVVTGFTLTGNPAHKISIDNQLLFRVGASELIIGKEVSAISNIPQVINGSSLTSTGFNKALNKLRADV